MPIEDEMILQGEALLIPPGKREKVPELIHQGHLYITMFQLQDIREQMTTIHAVMYAGLE